MNLRSPIEYDPGPRHRPWPPSSLLREVVSLIRSGESVIEFGGSSGLLAERLQEKEVRYVFFSSVLGDSKLFQASFDVAVAFPPQELFEIPTSLLLQTIHNSLRSGGRLIVAWPVENTRWRSRSSHPLSRNSFDDWATQLLEIGFRSVTEIHTKTLRGLADMALCKK